MTRKKKLNKKQKYNEILKGVGVNVFSQRVDN